MYCLHWRWTVVLSAIRKLLLKMAISAARKHQRSSVIWYYSDLALLQVVSAMLTFVAVRNLSMSHAWVTQTITNVSSHRRNYYTERGTCPNYWPECFVPNFNTLSTLNFSSKTLKFFFWTWGSVVNPSNGIRSLYAAQSLSHVISQLSTSTLSLHLSDKCQQKNVLIPLHSIYGCILSMAAFRYYISQQVERIRSLELNTQTWDLDTWRLLLQLQRAEQNTIVVQLLFRISNWLR